MATEANGFVQASIAATPTEVISAGANESVLLTTVIDYNADTESRLLTLYQVADGDAADASNVFLKQTVYRGQSVTVPIGALIVANGGALFADADVAAMVNLSVNYYRSDQQA